jgi:hypothetical protein
MALKWESFPDESLNISGVAVWHNNICSVHHTVYPGHALSALVFYYSLLLNVYDFIAAEIFYLTPKG